jgi:hypothetical protein
MYCSLVLWLNLFCLLSVEEPTCGNIESKIFGLMFERNRYSSHCSGMQETVPRID